MPLAATPPVNGPMKVTLTLSFAWLEPAKPAAITAAANADNAIRALRITILPLHALPDCGSNRLCAVYI